MLKLLRIFGGDPLVTVSGAFDELTKTAMLSVLIRTSILGLLLDGYTSKMDAVKEQFPDMKLAGGANSVVVVVSAPGTETSASGTSRANLVVSGLSATNPGWLAECEEKSMKNEAERAARGEAPCDCDIHRAMRAARENADTATADGTAPTVAAAASPDPAEEELSADEILVSTA